MTTHRKIMLTALAMVALSATFFAGLVAGYYAGWGDYAGRDVPASAVYTVGVLKKLRGGDTAQATSMLETKLDGDFMMRWAYDQRSHFLTSFLWPSGPEPRLLERAAQYRLEHPSEHPAPEVRDDISEVVRRYANAPAK